MKEERSKVDLVRDTAPSDIFSRGLHGEPSSSFTSGGLITQKPKFEEVDQTPLIIQIWEFMAKHKLTVKIRTTEITELALMCVNGCDDKAQGRWLDANKSELMAIQIGDSNAFFKLQKLFEEWIGGKCKTESGTHLTVLNLAGKQATFDALAYLTRIADGKAKIVRSGKEPVFIVYDGSNEGTNNALTIGLVVVIVIFLLGGLYVLFAT